MFAILHLQYCYCINCIYFHTHLKCHHQIYIILVLCYITNIFIDSQIELLLSPYVLCGITLYCHTTTCHLILILYYYLKCLLLILHYCVCYNNIIILVQYTVIMQSLVNQFIIHYKSDQKILVYCTMVPCTF